MGVDTKIGPGNVNVITWMNLKGIGCSQHPFMSADKEARMLMGQVFVHPSTELKNYKKVYWSYFFLN